MYRVLYDNYTWFIRTSTESVSWRMRHCAWSLSHEYNYPYDIGPLDWIRLHNIYSYPLLNWIVDIRFDYPLKHLTIKIFNFWSIKRISYWAIETTEILRWFETIYGGMTLSLDYCPYPILFKSWPGDIHQSF